MHIPYTFCTQVYTHLVVAVVVKEQKSALFPFLEKCSNFPKRLRLLHQKNPRISKNRMRNKSNPNCQLMLQLIAISFSLSHHGHNWPIVIAAAWIIINKIIITWGESPSSSGVVAFTTRTTNTVGRYTPPKMRGV